MTKNEEKLKSFTIKMPKFKVSVNKETCIGCGLCESICGEVFVMKDGKAHAKTSTTDKKCVKEAAESCPVNSIKIK